VSSSLLLCECGFYLGDVVCCDSRRLGLNLLSIKLVVKYAQLREIESMRAVAPAHQNRNLADFQKALKDYKVSESSFRSFAYR
jgi:hypothetical protein